MPRGSKTCPKCQCVTGPRSFKCKCGYEFVFKPKSLRKDKNISKEKKIHWKELQKGDVIKVVTGSGPVWITENSEEINMGYHGKFVVYSIGVNGIHAYPCHKTPESGRCYIYCGLETIGKSGTHLRPHKIILVKSQDSS